ncbi:MAG: metallophosphoesterase family protein [Clostridia bacterium]|nr:metallophosphoesterase family protein [Clostridia bacterium]
MDKVKSEKYQEEIKELFKEMVTDELHDKWADTFEIEFESEKQINVAYHGAENVKTFRKECKETLFSCISSVLGEGKKIRITKKSGYNSLSPKAKKNIRAFKFFVLGMLFVCIATAVIVVLFNYIGNRDFRETFYSTSSIKVDSRVRVIQLSDLHNACYGKDNEKLLERIEALEPDIIICTGDIVNSAVDDVDYAVTLAQGLSEIAPSYYVYGNNEVETIYGFPLNEKELDKNLGFDKSNRDETALLQLEDSFEEKLEGAGIKVLKNEKDTVKVKTMTVDVYGVLTSNPSSFWSYSEKAFTDYIWENPDNLKITAVHEPFIFEEFAPDFWGDLMLAGHTHGGVMRVPVLGPLYTREGGLFPERNGYFVYGRYDTAGKPLIVSSGLENSNVFRINNQPELVVIDINKF